jgi:hypothetical protein
MKYSARQLAAILKVQPSTITRDINKGRVSAAKNNRNEWEIEAAEIVRVYHDRVVIDEAGNVAAKTGMHDGAKAGTPDASAILRERLDAAERLLNERERTIDDLRRRLDASDQERRQMMALLTDQRAKSPEKGKEQRGWLARLFRPVPA